MIDMFICVFIAAQINILEKKQLQLEFILKNGMNIVMIILIRMFFIYDASFFLNKIQLKFKY